MRRVYFSLSGALQEYRFLDSVHAAVVSGWTAAGAEPGAVVGADAKPWTFAVKGFSQKGGLGRMSGLTISTADAYLAGFVDKMLPAAISARSTNGDVITLAGARRMVFDDPIAPSQTELACTFASPFAVPKPKDGRSRTEFFENLSGVDLSAAFSAGLSRRAGRPIELTVAVDRLTLVTQGARRLVSTRLEKGRRIVVPAFSLPLTLRGSPEDIRFAFFSGLGAKTRNGFGCPAALR